MNWIRAKLIDATCANDRATSVFARPGKSSIRTWPSASSPSRTSSSCVALADDRLLDLVEDPVGKRPAPRRRPSSAIRAAPARRPAASISRVDHVRAHGSRGGSTIRPDELPRPGPDELLGALGMAARDRRRAARELRRDDPRARAGGAVGGGRTRWGCRRRGGRRRPSSCRMRPRRSGRAGMSRSKRGVGGHALPMREPMRDDRDQHQEQQIGVERDPAVGAGERERDQDRDDGEDHGRERARRRRLHAAHAAAPASSSRSAPSAASASDFIESVDLVLAELRALEERGQALDRAAADAQRRQRPRRGTRAASRRAGGRVRTSRAPLSIRAYARITARRGSGSLSMSSSERSTAASSSSRLVRLDGGLAPLAQVPGRRDARRPGRARAGCSPTSESAARGRAGLLGAGGTGSRPVGLIFVAHGPAPGS